MFVCKDCGAAFEEELLLQEIHDELDGAYFEPVNYGYCPHCDGEYEEGYQCKGCGEWFTRDKIFDYSWCEDCLIEKLDAGSFLQYASSIKTRPQDINLIEEFLFFKILPAPDDMSFPVSNAFHECADFVYYSEYRKDPEYLREQIIEFMLSDKSLLDEFARWLNE